MLYRRRVKVTKGAGVAKSRKTSSYLKWVRDPIDEQEWYRMALQRQEHEGGEEQHVQNHWQHGAANLWGREGVKGHTGGEKWHGQFH